MRHFIHLRVNSTKVNKTKALAGAGGWISGRAYGLYVFLFLPFVPWLFHGECEGRGYTSRAAHTSPGQGNRRRTSYAPLTVRQKSRTVNQTGTGAPA